MRDQSGMSRFDRVVGCAAGMVFWAIMGSICLVLKLFYHLQPRYTRNDIGENETVATQSTDEGLNGPQRTSV